MDFFFDAHFHATLKKQFANPNQQVPVPGLPMFNPWKTTERKDYLAGFNLISLAKCVLKPFVESTLVSQASLTQLTASNYKLAIVALIAPDRGLLELITNNVPFMNIVTQGKFGDILVDTQFNQLQTTNDAFAIIQRDLVLLALTNAGQRVKLLTTTAFDPQPADPPALVFSIEGLHCLRSDLSETNPQTISTNILTNLATLTAGHTVVTINIAHIDGTNVLFANQAYAADGFREGGFNEANLHPVGNGFTEAGQQIARELYNREILPDVKHMSWLARRQFYAFRDTEAITAPIVCSHAGFAGCWFNSHGEHLSDYILKAFTIQNHGGNTEHRIILGKPNPYLERSGVGFNASTINLFNEDIAAILKSDGLIGLSLDQRILGYSDFVDDGNTGVSRNVLTIQDGFDELRVVTDSDFIADGEFSEEPLFGTISHRIDKVRQCVRTEDRQTNNSLDIRDFFHPRHFYLHVVHALEVARMVGREDGGSAGGEAAATKMLTRTLCIGSDFDGLIDGLDCCPDVVHIGEFKQKFVSEFGAFVTEAGSQLPAGLTAAKVADSIFYENGRDFVLRRLAVLQAPVVAAPVVVM